MTPASSQAHLEYPSEEQVSAAIRACRIPDTAVARRDMRLALRAATAVHSSVRRVWGWADAAGRVLAASTKERMGAGGGVCAAAAAGFDIALVPARADDPARDAARYGALLEECLPLMLRGVEYHTKAQLDEALDRLQRN